MEYLKSIGVVAQEGENALKALQRHAKKYQWNPKTYKKHKKILEEAVASYVEEKLDDLDSMNSALEKFGLEPETSRKNARDALAALHVNIYDFEAGMYIDHGSLQALRKYTTKNNYIYPRNAAKDNGFKVFLKKLF